MHWQLTVIDLSQWKSAAYAGYPIGAEEEYSLFFQITTSTDEAMVIDIAYIAVVDDIAEISGLTDDENCYLISEWVGGDAAETPIDPSSPPTPPTPPASCGEHVLSATSEKDASGNTVYTTACSVCGAAIAKQTIGTDVNYFNHGFNIDKDVSSNVTREFMIDEETNIPFIRINSVAGKHIPLTNTAPGLQFNGGDVPSSGLSTAEKYKPGKYLVLYHRIGASVADSGGKFWLWAGHSDTVSSNMSDTSERGRNPGGEPRYNGLIKTVTDWQMTVIDLSEWNYGTDGYPTESEELYSLFFALQTEGGAVEIDIAYIATVDSLDELAALPGAEAVNNNCHVITTWKSGAAAETPIASSTEK